MSSPPLRAISSSPTQGAAESFSLTEPICCVVQLKHQPPGVVHQVTLDPAKIRGELIRIGEWPGDEARGWQFIANVGVLAVLGRAKLTKRDGSPWEGSESDKWVTVTPIIEREPSGPDPVDG